MKKERTINTALRIAPSEKMKLEKAAEERGMTVTDLLLDGARMVANWDPSFLSRIDSFSRGLNLPQYLVLQNLAISWMARKDAETEVWGQGTSMLKEFMFTDAGPITGEQIYGILKSGFVHDLEGEKIDFLRTKGKQKGLTVEEQSWFDKHSPHSAPGASKIDPITGEEGDAEWTPEVKK